MGWNRLGALGHIGSTDSMATEAEPETPNPYSVPHGHTVTCCIISPVDFSGRLTGQGSSGVIADLALTNGYTHTMLRSVFIAVLVSAYIY